MKTIFVILGLCLSSFAQAKQDSAAVLKDPTVQAVFKLMNDKHANQCQLPKEDRVDWRCFGWRAPVTEPTIESQGCRFSVIITCPGEKAEISGVPETWYLNSPTPTTVKPVEGGIRIWDVKFF